MGNDIATLERFLQTGELGPIRLGMSESEVKTVLRSPTFWMNGKDPLIAYGALQLAFVHPSGAAEAELKDIGLSFSPASEANLTPNLVWPLEDFEGLSSQSTFDQVREFLDRVGLWKEVKSWKGEEDLLDLVIPPPGARITFHGGKLWSIHFTDRTPPKKQISLSVSEATLDQLKLVARQSKKSVSALCAEWITQRANELHRALEDVASRG